MKGERRMKLSRGIFEGDFVLWSCEMFLVGRRKILMVIEGIFRRYSESRFTEIDILRVIQRMLNVCLVEN